MEEHLAPTFTQFGLVFDISTILMMLVSCLLVFLLVFFAARNMTSRTPRGMQNFLEWVIQFIRGIAGQSMDNKTAERFVTLGLTLFIYIFIANQQGLVLNFVGGGGDHPYSWWKSPTAAVSVPFALAVMVLFYSHWLGMRSGVGKYLKSFASPHWALLPLNIIEELAKFLSFPLRLYGNIFAGEVLIWVLLPAILVGGVSSVLSVPLVVWLGYSIFVGAIQAYIFTILTMVYISHRLHSADSH
jgi:F-type H+-transporting ATPase subunit a